MIAIVQNEAPYLPIGFVCKHFGVSRSGYYDWLKRYEEKPLRFNRKQEIMEAIQNFFAENYRTYGSQESIRSLKRRGFT